MFSRVYYVYRIVKRGKRNGEKDTRKQKTENMSRVRFRDGEVGTEGMWDET